ncbi:MAG: 1-deoxy-D-xylulose-5-phosphate synthase [Campylobacterales bacterium]|nr:1-deoxy-D-xylulose-5-phosphate synthase [Campylobacterales bacterium]
MDIKSYTIEELEELAKKIRLRILNVVSKNGGHLSSTLGAVDLIIGMHVVFDSKSDPFIFDVSHQCYAHKLLTGRWDEFETLRQFGGISGFTKPSESVHDYFIAGHSSTSISLAVGSAKAIELKKEDRVPVCLIGDGSMTAGMVYEALNELGDRKYPCVIILNDNEMSIAKPIGAISKYLSSAMASPFYQKIKYRIDKFLSKLPESAIYMAKRFEESLRLITPGLLFEELGIEYIGPIDGHNIEEIIETLKTAKELKKPVIIHAQTTKGKGYEIAEGPYEHWHGVGPFDIESGKAVKNGKVSATNIFSDELLKLASLHEDVVGITAAMPSGTGIKQLMDKYPNRFWDVAIAEQHAITQAATLAKEGFKPFVAIYSTFLQRAYDQIVHDVCISNMPVIFAIDRAGIVGEDGETHQGVFDISYLRAIPNMVLFAPRDTLTLQNSIHFAYNLNKPCAFRYPRGTFLADNSFEFKPFEFAKSQMLIENGGDILFIGYGNGVGRAYLTMNELKHENISLLDLRFVKPLDEEMLLSCSKKYKKWFIFSDSSFLGGVASAISELLMQKNVFDIKISSFEYEDKFIPHGKTTDIEEFLELTPTQLAKKVKELL